MNVKKEWFVLFFISLLWVPALMGQTAGTGALTGTVKDSSGAVIPSATVTAMSADTGQTRTAMTGADGAYTVSLLPPGNYRVRIEAGGFKPVEIPSITINVTETAVLDRGLEVGTSIQTVTVQGEVETVQTASSALGTVMNTQTVAALPLSTRNYTNLLAMSAGASSDVVNSATLGKSLAVISVNGAASGQNTYQQDGVSVNNWMSTNSNAEGTLYGAFPIPNPDTIAEFKIQTSNYDAGYGRKPGANVNVITKSGTNDFHGTAFEFFRNTALNANDFFRNATVGTNGNDGSKLVLNQNQYGGVFGGPIKKDKLFLFVSYQQTNQKNGISGFGYSVVTLPPIPNMPRGSCPAGWTSLSQCNAAAQAFVPALGAAVCPANNPTNTNDKIKTTGSITVACNGSNINPVAINLLQLTNGNAYLVPGSTSGDHSLASFTDPATYLNHQGMGNWDYVINGKHTLSGRYFYEADPTTGHFAANGTSTTASAVLPGNPVSEQKTNHAAMLRLTSLLSNNMVNEARVSYQRNLSATQELGPYTNSQVGITDITPGIDNLTDVTISGLPLTFGNNQSFISSLNTNQFEWAEQLSWAHGKHTIRTGFEAERVQADIITPGSAIGNPTFQSFPDFLIGRAGCVPGTAGPGPTQCNASNPGTSNGTTSSNGQKFTAATTANGGFPYNSRVILLSAFVQDDVKLTPRLTVNAGVRWEYDGFPSEEYGMETLPTSGQAWSTPCQIRDLDA